MLSFLKNKIKFSTTGLILNIALVGVLAFQLGRISISQNSDAKIELQSANLADLFSSPNQTTGSVKTYSNSQKPSNSTPISTPKIVLKVVASKNSKSKLYHFLWCSGAKRIKLENLIEFQSEAEAISRGYTLAGNCTR